MRQCAGLFRGDGREQMPRHAGDHHARTAVGDHRTEGIQTQRHPQQVDLQNRFGGRLHRRQTRGVHHVHHRARRRGVVGECSQRVGRRDVDVVAGGREALGSERIHTAVECLLVEVGEDQMVTGGLSARDGLTHAAGPHDHDHLTRHDVSCLNRCAEAVRRVHVR